MGREIRRVPVGWEHPRSTPENKPFYMDGRWLQIKPEYLQKYQPLHDKTLADAIKEYDELKAEWEAATPEQRKEKFYDDGDATTFEEVDYTSDPRQYADYYRPEWPADAVMGYCMYETTSEGTPISPVFATKEELGDWLVTQGYSEGAIESFLRTEYAPTGAFMGGSGGRFVRDLEVLNLPKDEDE